MGLGEVTHSTSIPLPSGAPDLEERIDDIISLECWKISQNLPRHHTIDSLTRTLPEFKAPSELARSKPAGIPTEGSVYLDEVS